MFNNMVLTKAHYKKNGLENDYYESKYTNNGMITDFGYKYFQDHNKNTCTEIYVKRTVDKDNNIYNSNKKISKLTKNNINNSNETYIELFRVVNGIVVDEKNNDVIIDDEFCCGAIKSYRKHENDIVVDWRKKTDTSGFTQMTSKCYLIKSFKLTINLNTI